MLLSTAERERRWKREERREQGSGQYPARKQNRGNEMEKREDSRGQMAVPKRQARKREV